MEIINPINFKEKKISIMNQYYLFYCSSSLTSFKQNNSLFGSFNFRTFVTIISSTQSTLSKSQHHTKLKRKLKTSVYIYFEGLRQFQIEHNLRSVINFCFTTSSVFVYKPCKGETTYLPDAIGLMNLFILWTMINYHILGLAFLTLVINFY